MTDLIHIFPLEITDTYPLFAHKILKTQDHHIFNQIISHTNNLLDDYVKKMFQVNIKINTTKYKIKCILIHPKISPDNNNHYEPPITFTIRLYTKDTQLILEVHRYSGCIVEYYNNIYNFFMTLDL